MLPFPPMALKRFAHGAKDAKKSLKKTAVEALLGRYTGDDKWQLALEKMEALGWNVDAQQVIDALKAAWQKIKLGRRRTWQCFKCG